MIGERSRQWIIDHPPEKTEVSTAVPKLQSLESRTLKALKRLKVKPEALLAAPPITDMIKTTVKGGLRLHLRHAFFNGRS